MLCYCFLLFFIFETQGQTCDPYDQCSCKMSDTGKSVSLWALDYSSSPRFKGVKQDHDTSLTTHYFDYNTCTPFNEGPNNACHEQLLCQRDTAGNYYPVAGFKTLVTKLVDGKVVFKYQGAKEGDVSRSVSITLICDQSATVPVMSHPIENLVTPGSFTFTLTTQCACPGTCSNSVTTSGLSTGSLLLILLLVFVLVYVIGGFLLLKFVYKKEGTEVIPQYEFWKDFPAKVKDGVLFVKSKVTKKGNEYEKI